MERYFPAAAPFKNTSAIEVGSSSLVGDYVCSYRKCSGSYAQLGRFQALSFGSDGRIVARAAVCTPECAASYNRYVLSACDPESDEARARHAMLEKVYGRRIQPAPAPSRTQDTDRMDWLRVCRAQLSPAEQEVAERELSVQSVVVYSVPHIK